MESDELEQRVRAFLAERLPWLPLDLPEQTDVVGVGRIYGDDVWELVTEFGKRFEVDMTGFRWEHHSGPEGCNPLWLILPPWWSRSTYIPIRVRDLINSARCRKWSIRYPG